MDREKVAAPLALQGRENLALGEVLAPGAPLDVETVKLLKRNRILIYGLSLEASDLGDAAKSAFVGLQFVKAGLLVPENNCDHVPDILFCYDKGFKPYASTRQVDG
jgi:hypothetical protein